MVDSVITRGQAIYDPEAGSSGLLQVGVFQTALLDVISYPSGSYLQQDWNLYISQSVDSVVGVLRNASAGTEEFPLDRLSVGRGLKYQLEKTRNESYADALDVLRTSIELQPRNKFGGLWYYTYPNWSYLDGMFSLLSFYEVYTTTFSNPSKTRKLEIDFIHHQLDLLYSHCYDNTTGLLFHGYDASKAASWADPVTGASPFAWDRALGWFMMGLVDFLEYTLSHSRSYNSDVVHTWRKRFMHLSDALVRAADPESGAWWQVLNVPGREGNYIESSGSAMFVYTLYKGARLGLLPSPETPNKGYDYTGIASKAYQTLVDRFVIENNDRTLSYNGTVGVCSLNSTASYEYYVNQPLVYDSVLGSAAFIRASAEHELHADAL
ncbi:hypothetical protein BDV06DRAFT_214394 [Aspergillus oleicola]